MPRTPWIFSSRGLGTLFLASCALLCVSCGGVKPGMSEVNGKVLYKGQPAVGAQVIFHPEKDDGVKTITPAGTVEEDGSFTLYLNREEKGAPPGKYYVFVRWPEDAAPDLNTGKLGKRGHGKKAVPGDFFQGKYCDHKNPKFRAEIVMGRNDLEPFVVE